MFFKERRSNTMNSAPTMSSYCLRVSGQMDASSFDAPLSEGRADLLPRVLGLIVGAALLVGCSSGTCAPAGDSGGCGYPRMPRPTAVRDFDSCVASGGVVESSVPPQVCRTADGMIFSQFYSTSR